MTLHGHNRKGIAFLGFFTIKLSHSFLLTAFYALYSEDMSEWYFWKQTLGLVQLQL